jgi:murein DD-endopeptidase MepM/ murein hydrolase activator NlpD
MHPLLTEYQPQGRWRFPLRHCAGIPVNRHPGAFGCVRKRDIHTGVDLYCPENEPVFAVEEGVVVAIEVFTGPRADSPWWNETQALLVEGASGVVCYGEVHINEGLDVGVRVEAGQEIGHVVPVLKPMQARSDIPGHSRFMLHLELYKHGTRAAVWWRPGEPRPAELLDPTPYLLAAEEVTPGQTPPPRR